MEKCAQKGISLNISQKTVDQILLKHNLHIPRPRSKKTSDLPETVNAGILGAPVPACLNSADEVSNAGLSMAKIAVSPGGNIALKEDESAKPVLNTDLKTSLHGIAIIPGKILI